MVSSGLWQGVLTILLFLVVQEGFAEPYFTDLSGNPLTTVRTLCGENKMVKMTDENDKIKKMGTPIGIYKLNVDGGTGWCTGTLISKDLFITARHCAGECMNTTVSFGYLQRRDLETFRCKEMIEKGNDENDPSSDYLIIRLEGSPGIQWGWYDMSDKELTNCQPLMIIHHPLATPMKVSIKGCEFRGETSGLMKHRCDTQQGSSGSALLLPDFDHPENTRIVGIHTLGGCTEDVHSTNSGPSIRHLSQISPLIHSMIRP